MGSFSILTSVSRINAQNQLTANNVNLNRTLLRLSSGKRINSGADDAAGLRIADALRANIRALDQAARNANDGVAVSQIADGALDQMTSLLSRAVTLAEEAATGTVDSTGRASLNAEYQQIQAEVARIAQNTNFNGVGLFTTSGLNGSLSVFVGDMSGVSSVSVTISTITSSGSVVTSLGGQNLNAVSLTTQAAAATALTTIKNALGSVGAMRADVGAGINRLQSAVAVLQNQSQNTQAAESIFRDANIAEEVGNMTKFQILSQSGIAALAQANAQSQLVLSLFQG